MTTPSKAATAREVQLDITMRELQVLLGMSHGRSNGDIAKALFLSEDTVKSHAARLFRKLGARDRAHAVRLGFEYRLLPLNGTVSAPRLVPPSPQPGDPPPVSGVLVDLATILHERLGDELMAFMDATRPARRPARRPPASAT